LRGHQVGTSAKRLVARSGEDRDPQGRIALELVENCAEFMARISMESVAPLGPVHFDGQDVTISRDIAVLIFHDAFLSTGRLPRTYAKCLGAQSETVASQSRYSASCMALLILRFVSNGDSRQGGDMAKSR
jgi:hypothetical protein